MPLDEFHQKVSLSPEDNWKMRLYETHRTSLLRAVFCWVEFVVRLLLVCFVQQRHYYYLDAFQFQGGAVGPFRGKEVSWRVNVVERW